MTYVRSSTGVVARLDLGTGTGGDAEGDRLSSIEVVEGSNFDDTLIAQNGVDMSLNGAGGNDLLVGLSGNDTLFGGDDDDRLEGLGGADNLRGGDGIDVALYNRSASGVVVRLDLGTGVGGDADGDVLSSVEAIVGSGFNDTLIGGTGIDSRLDGFDGNDLLIGIDGNDTLIGGNGGDRLQGNAGNDLLTTGGGADVVYFGDGDGTDTVSDFVAGAGVTDTVRLLRFGTDFDTFSEVIAAASDNGSDTTIDFGQGDILTLNGVLVSELNVDDFIFG